MKRILIGLALLAGLSTTANAGDYLVDKMEYIDRVGSCDIKVYKGLTMDITVVCGSKGSGNCSGHTWDGNFYCRSSGTSSGSNTNGVLSSINWILNNL